MARSVLTHATCFAAALALAACRESAQPPTSPSFLYSDEFYGFDHALCDPPTNPECKPHSLTASQRRQVNDAIAALTCPNLQDYLFGLAMDGGIRSYDTDDGNWADSHWPSNPEVHIWSGTFGPMLAETLAHEAAHIAYATVDESIASQAEIDCGTRR